MWFKFVLLFSLGFGGVQSGSYDFGQIAKAISNNLNCLERTPDLSFNATYSLSLALGELYRISTTTSILDADKIHIIDTLIARFDAFLQRAIIAFPTNPVAQLIWYPQYWTLPQYGDYSYVSGRIPKMPLTHQTFLGIFERSFGSNESIGCRNQLLGNGASATPRVCTTPCIDQVESPDFTKGFSGEARFLYISIESLLNCTNHSPEQTFAILEKSCQYMKTLLDFMYYKRHDKQFTDLYYYFQTKVVLCAGAGYPEFLSKEIVSLVLRAIQCDGCVGFPEVYSLDVRQVLTAQTAAILSSVLRLVAEQDYPPLATIEPQP